MTNVPYLPEPEPTTPLMTEPTSSTTKPTTAAHTIFFLSRNHHVSSAVEIRNSDTTVWRFTASETPNDNPTDQLTAQNIATISTAAVQLPTLSPAPTLHSPSKATSWTGLT